MSIPAVLVLYEGAPKIAVENLALLSTKLDVGGDLIRAFGEQNLCGRLMLLFRHNIVESVLTFVENFLTRGNEDQIQVHHDSQVLHHLRLVIAEPAGDLVIDSTGADLIPVFRVLRSLVMNAMDLSPPMMSASRTIGYLCFGSPSPPFDKLRPSSQILQYLVDLESRIGEEAHPAIIFTFRRRESVSNPQNSQISSSSTAQVKLSSYPSRMSNSNPQNNVLRHSTNTEAYVQILGTGMDTQETSPSVLLFFDNERFIFNAGEGLQRFCMEHKIKLSQVDHICLTRVCSKTTGGLPGLLLTLAGMNNGSPESIGHVSIWGPPDLDLLVNAMKNFVPHAVMEKTNIIPQSDNVTINGNRSALAPPIHAQELQAKPKFKAVSLSAILLSPTHLAGSHFSSNDTSIVYICKLHDIRGKVDLGKAKACGLKQGRKLGQLQDGISVKSDLLDTEVHPDDVIGPPIPGPIVLIVDCPTEPHAQELLSAQALDAYYSDSQSNSPETTKVVNCIIHLSPATVVSSPAYEKWMTKFGSAQHIMARTTRKHETIPILVSSARIARRLHYLCPQLFPAPSLPSVQNDDDVAAPNIKGSVCGISAENLLKETRIGQIKYSNSDDLLSVH
ncbi:hypothetical protein HAX54_048544 [Datura stramonium]|uniref:ribonuclease Z n=1 Tax=Datura stramonium TaxID=4076 RepID=A0ABS8STT3_DATST|nr:hypothetical protein [Datura stramonium]